MHKEQKTFQISDYKIWTESLGNIKNPAVLLISGAVAHAHFWTDLFVKELVQSGYFVIRYDHRDVGLSFAMKNLQKAYGIEDLTLDARAILDAYGIEKAHLVGHSMGGVITQVFAKYYSDRILSMICINAGPAAATSLTDIPYSFEERAIIEETRQISMDNKPTENFEESLVRYMKIWKRWNGKLPLDEELAIEFTKEYYTRTKQGIKKKPHPHMRAVSLGLETMEERRGFLSTIHVPTLVIQGEEDYLLLPRRGGYALAKELPQATLKSISNMGHMFFHKESQLLIAHLIIDFIKSTSIIKK